MVGAGSRQTAILSCRKSDFAPPTWASGQRTPLDRPSLTALLTRLGNSPDEVASTLKGGGIRGIRNAARFFNPLVRYLHGQIGTRALTIDVMQWDRVRVLFDDGSQEEALLPSAILLFLDAFNRGAYPELHLP